MGNFVDETYLFEIKDVTCRENQLQLFLRTNYCIYLVSNKFVKMMIMLKEIN